MSNFVAVARVAELPPGARLHYAFAEETVIVLNVGGEFFAIADLCTHDGGPLEDGEVCDHQIECLRHGARFDIRTGAVTRMPAVIPVKWFPTRVENDEIQIGLDD